MQVWLGRVSIYSRQALTDGHLGPRSDKHTLLSNDCSGSIICLCKITVGLSWLLTFLCYFVLSDVELGRGAVVHGCVCAHSRGITEVCAHVTEAEVVTVVFRFIR